jgi:hypothetical protein
VHDLVEIETGEAGTGADAAGRQAPPPPAPSRSATAHRQPQRTANPDQPVAQHRPRVAPQPAQPREPRPTPEPSRATVPPGPAAAAAAGPVTPPPGPATTPAPGRQRAVETPRSTPAAPPAPAQPAAHPDPAAAKGPAEDREAAAWLEELALEGERVEPLASSDILAQAAARAEEELEDDEVWDQESVEAGAPPSRAGIPDPRVVVIDDDTDIPVPSSRPSGDAEPQTGGARVGATLEDEGGRKKRWRLFRKGGE